MPPQIVVLESPDAVADALATRTAEALRRALASEPRASLCLTGGSTPAPAYRQLAEAPDLDWNRVHVFWGDDRAVGPDDEDSNYRLARETLLDAIDLPEDNVHRVEGERGAEPAARLYESELETFFGDAPVRFDVLHLGMGSDGHTASLFPGSPALDETERRVVDTLSPPSSPVLHRISLTFPSLSHSALTLVAAHGEGKREPFAEAVEAYGGAATAGPPVSRVRPEGELVWLVDRRLADGIA